MPLTTKLDADALAAVLLQVPTLDWLPAALACTALRDVCVALATRLCQEGQPLFITDPTSSLARAQWAICVMGATPRAWWGRSAASRGDTRLLTHLHLRHSMPLTKDLCYGASWNAHIGVLQWLHFEMGVDWSTGCYDRAISNPELQSRDLMAFLQWLHSNGCPFSSGNCISAVQASNIAVLQWLRSRNPPCPWNKARCLRECGILMECCMPDVVMSDDPMLPVSLHMHHWIRAPGLLTMYHWIYMSA